jgi:hypothetical protein
VFLDQGFCIRNTIKKINIATNSASKFPCFAMNTYIDIGISIEAFNQKFIDSTLLVLIYYINYIYYINRKNNY